ncbi:MAG: hypothetical protein EAZ30_06905 [Betaproteobacteria bacterium]|nr:MAG: hypothetical protein EAZ30_06905 [Betaproteobacteria bacterium]
MSTHDFNAFIESAWNDHADDPKAVAARLQSSTQLINAAEYVAPFARITTHVFGEHLGRWSEGITLLQSLRSLSAWDVTAHGGVIDRNVAALRFCDTSDQATASAALQTFSLEDKISVLATAAACLAGAGQSDRAAPTLDAAIELADTGLKDGSPAFRALAIAGNNIAGTLEELPARDAAQTAMMLKAANAGVRFWTLAGTWLETERAYYRLANSLIAANQPAEAIEAATRCIDICEKNTAPAFEKFFGHAMKAIAARAAGKPVEFDAARMTAMAQYEAVPDDEKSWCKRELDLLAA